VVARHRQVIGNAVWRPRAVGWISHESLPLSRWDRHSTSEPFHHHDTPVPVVLRGQVHDREVDVRRGPLGRP